MFFDSSVRSTRTIGLAVAELCDAARPSRDSTSSSAARSRSAVSVDAERVHAQTGRAPVVRDTDRPSSHVGAEHVGAALPRTRCAHRGEWKPAWSAPSMPSRVSRATSGGSSRK